MSRAVFLACLVASVVFAAPRRVSLRTYDGRTVTGDVLMESTQGLVVKTTSGTELVPWSAISETADEQPRAAERAPDAQPEPRGTHLGVTIGVGPGFTPRQDPTSLAVSSTEVNGWHTLELGFFLQLEPSELVSLRFGVPLMPGLVTRGPSLRPLFKGFFGVSGDVRVNFSERFSSGIGLRLGATVSGQSSPVVGYAAFAPSLTALSARLGAARQYEVTLDVLAFFGLADRGASTAIGFDGLIGVVTFGVHF